TACTEAAIATLTYVYSDRAAVVSPLAPVHEPHCYDLCAEHAARLTAPRGWDVVRRDVPPTGRPTVDDLEALADAVREPSPFGPDGGDGLRRGHLRMLRPPAPTPAPHGGG
ncbi:MAG TPA: DUF3499 domain-containing protein, partial [Mycobacteriales bacterium]|nr:DUF3499 domain-containing protein [Mycobacteriales bacterium]